MTKICFQCKEDKPLTDFYSHSKKKDGVNDWCKVCFNKYCIQRWIEIKKKAIEYKGGKCASCSYDKYYGALEFHHLDPAQKDVAWNKLRLRSWDKIVVELDKCILLCSNCHRETHKV